MRRLVLGITLALCACRNDEQEAKIERMSREIDSLRAQLKEAKAPPPPAPEKTPEQVLAQRLPDEGTWKQLAFSGEKERRRAAAFLLSLCKDVETAECRPLQIDLFIRLTRQPTEWKRYLGQEIVDERGRVLDVEHIAKTLKSRMIRTYGKERARDMIRDDTTLGLRTGSAVFNVDYDAIEQLADE